ncbi:DUF3784 domain-containing protein [Solibacillus sp. FSL R7-0668]|uniref:DUF3784 domain-containing protein n=1 Tax=Solibacillus sp. FSL R7-0668 TaxID=2921688 RepID=UPI0030FB512D
MIWLLLAALFIFLGFAIQRLKWHFLISGYNTMTKEQKENVDVEGLAKLMGNYLYALAILFIVVGLVDYLEYSNLILPLLSLILVFTIIVVVKAQKFDHNLFDDNGKWKPGASKNLKRQGMIIVITLIIVAVILYFSLQPTGVAVTENEVEIAGMYGDTYEFASMEQVTLLEALPEIALRTNGSAVGSKLKGHFKFENGDKAKLFVDTKNPPFIQFIDEGKTVIFNLQTEAETRALYEKLIANTK